MDNPEVVYERTAQKMHQQVRMLLYRQHVERPSQYSIFQLRSLLGSFELVNDANGYLISSGGQLIRASISYALDFLPTR